MASFGLSSLDLAVFLVAGIIGALSGTFAAEPRWRWGAPVAWFVIALWSLLKLLGVLPQY